MQTLRKPCRREAGYSCFTDGIFPSIIAPKAGKKFDRSAKEKRELGNRIFQSGYSCYPEPPIRGLVNERKHLARQKAGEQKVADGKRKEEEAAAAEKERLKPANLRKALELGENLPLKQQLMAVYDSEEVSGLATTCIDYLEREFAAAKQKGEGSSLRGKKILDIGCGSDWGDADTDFFPWFSRAAHMLGARAIGIDIGNNDGESFEHVQADLSESGKLATLFGKGESSTFDAIVMCMFLNIGGGGATSPKLKRMLRHWELVALESEMFGEFLRLLKEGGILIQDEKKFRKMDGRLVRTNDR